jgi:hypothetical protein
MVELFAETGSAVQVKVVLLMTAVMGLRNGWTLMSGTVEVVGLFVTPMKHVKMVFVRLLMIAGMGFVILGRRVRQIIAAAEAIRILQMMFIIVGLAGMLVP